MPVWHRREFAGLVVGAAVSTVVPTVSSQAGDVRKGKFLGSVQDRFGINHVGYFDPVEGAGTWAPLPGRGHGVVLRPGTTDVVMVARRPGMWALVFDRTTGQERRWIEAREDRHFYGHGVFDPNGQLLYLTENAFEPNGLGVIGVYDAARGYTRVGELPSHGIGPHELVLAGEGRSLVVANGGIRTHPDRGREKLNLNSMRPSIAIIDRHDGTLLDRLEAPPSLHQVSLRHLAVGKDGAILCGGQFEGPDDETPPLIVNWRPGEQPVFLEAPDRLARRMANYCGSVAVDVTGTVFGVTHPRGAVTTFWDGVEGRLLGHTRTLDGGGIAADGIPSGFTISSGTGRVWRYLVGEGRLICNGSMNFKWDNHLGGQGLWRL